MEPVPPLDCAAPGDDDNADVAALVASSAMSVCTSVTMRSTLRASEWIEAEDMRELRPFREVSQVEMIRFKRVRTWLPRTFLRRWNGSSQHCRPEICCHPHRDQKSLHHRLRPGESSIRPTPHRHRGAQPMHDRLLLLDYPLLHSILALLRLV